MKVTQNIHLAHSVRHTTLTDDAMNSDRASFVLCSYWFTFRPWLFISAPSLYTHHRTHINLSRSHHCNSAKHITYTAPQDVHAHHVYSISRIQPHETYSHGSIQPKHTACTPRKRCFTVGHGSGKKRLASGDTCPGFHAAICAADGIVQLALPHIATIIGHFQHKFMISQGNSLHQFSPHFQW